MVLHVGNQFWTTPHYILRQIFVLSAPMYVGSVDLPRNEVQDIIKIKWMFPSAFTIYTGVMLTQIYNDYKCNQTAKRSA